MNTTLKIVLSVLIVFLVVTGSAIFYLSRGINTGKDIELKGTNLTNIKDGIYFGEYKAGRWSNKLNIVIQKKKIVKIDVKEDVTFAKTEVMEELFNRVIKEQDTRVDSVSGATVTSKAYLKAIENGLNNN